MKRLLDFRGGCAKRGEIASEKERESAIARESPYVRWDSDGKRDRIRDRKRDRKETRRKRDRKRETGQQVRGVEEEEEKKKRQEKQGEKRQIPSDDRRIIFKNMS